jgi:cytoplasmic iron level regulating protein YaaA (DUF328/UPF0246 family)
VGGTVTSVPDAFAEPLAAARAQVLEALAGVVRSHDDFARVSKVRGELLARAHDATVELLEGTAPLLPAWRRYEGVVWAHLDPSTLTEPQRRHLLIPSALYGLNGGLDRIADYRLTFKVALAPLGGLARFWRDPVSATLDATRGTLVNLLPKEHEAVLDRGALGSRLLDVRFVTHDGGSVVGHDAKAVKGVVARTLATEGLEALDGLVWRGWRASATDKGFNVRAPKPA